MLLIKESRKKSSLANGQAIKRGGGIKCRAIKEKYNFFWRLKKKNQMAIKLEGAEELSFCGFPNNLLYSPE